MKTFKTFMAVIATVLVSTSAMASGSNQERGDKTTQQNEYSYTMSDETLDGKLLGTYKATFDNGDKFYFDVESNGRYYVNYNRKSGVGELYVGKWQKTQTPGVYLFEDMHGKREISFFGQYIVDQSGQMWDCVK